MEKKVQESSKAIYRYLVLCGKSDTKTHYDMYWDEKPGWNPVPPQTPKEDHPPL